MYVIGLSDGERVYVEDRNSIDVAASGALVVRDEAGTTVAAFKAWEFFREAGEGD